MLYSWIGASEKKLPLCCGCRGSLSHCPQEGRARWNLQHWDQLWNVRCPACQRANTADQRDQFGIRNRKLGGLRSWQTAQWHAISNEVWKNPQLRMEAQSALGRRNKENSWVVPREFPQLEGCRKGLGALSSSATIYLTADQRKGHFLPHSVTWHHVPALPPGWDSVQSPQMSSIGPGFRVISSAADALDVGRTRPLVLRRGRWWHSSPTSPAPEGLGFYVLTNISGLMVWKWNKNEAYWALFNF